MFRTHSVATLAIAPLVVIAAACASSGGTTVSPAATAASTSSTSVASTSTSVASTSAPVTSAAPAPATSAGPPTTAFTCRRTPSSWDDNVRLGDCDTHGFVQTIEDRLTVLGYPCTVDNQFRADTDAALRNFQRDKGLTADGQVGPNTWAALTEGGIGD